MTDTTDIAALRIKAANVIGLLTAESLTGSFALDSLADVFDDMFRLLEAERQRAAGSEEELHKALHREKAAERKLLAAQEEIAALKGDQVPVAWTDAEELRGMEKDGCGYLFKVDPANPFTDPRRQIMLFDRQQKPVVLPHGHKPYLVRSQTTAPRAAMTANGDWLHRVQVVEAIEAAGGKVTK